MKRFYHLALAAAITGSMVLPVAAAPASNSYTATIIVNGEKLDTSKLPASDLLPMRLIVEADHGFAGWDPEANESYFVADKSRITVDLATNTVKAGDETIASAQVEVRDGVTFLSKNVLQYLEGYYYNLEVGTDTYVITTPNNAPLVKLSYQIMDQTNMARGMKNSQEEIKEYLGIRTENFDELVAFTPLNVKSDTIIIGHVTGSMEEARADLQTRQDAVIASFENYLPGPHQMAKEGQIVEQGEYIMLIISPDPDKAAALFQDAVKGL